MKRKKKFLKQREVVPNVTSGMGPSHPPVKKDFLVDGPARLGACLWAISLTFAYGVVNELVLGRPVYKVRMEAFWVCLATFVVQLVLFYKRSTYAPLHHQFTEWLWCSIKRLEERKFVRLTGVSALAFVLIVNATPIANIEPAIAAERLRKSDVGLVPGMESGLQDTDPAYRFRQVSSRLEKAIQERTPGDAEALSGIQASLAKVVQNVRLPENVSQAAKLELAYLQSYESLSRIGAANPQFLHQLASAPVVQVPDVPGINGPGPDKLRIILAPDYLGPFITVTDANPRFFSGFSIISFTFGHDPKLPMPLFAVADGADTATVFNNITVQGLAQDIGNLTWTNATFVGCLIRYHGQPVPMGNVRFINCTFERSKDGRGQQLLDYLSTHQGEPVNIYVP